MIPVYINVRDRVTDLRLMVDWLERAGTERIVLVDNHSSWPPLVEYLHRTPHEVVWLGNNVGSRALWDLGMLPDCRFVWSDPDIVPIAECPLDLVDHLSGLLDRYPDHDKAAVGLYLDDVPADMPSLAWEHRLLAPQRGDPWRGMLEPGVFDSLSDTTFAVYREHAPFDLRALRTGFPYQARHSTWYMRHADAEHRHYLGRAKHGADGSSWAENRGLLSE